MDAIGKKSLEAIISIGIILAVGIAALITTQSLIAVAEAAANSRGVDIGQQIEQLRWLQIAMIITIVVGVPLVIIHYTREKKKIEIARSKGWQDYDEKRFCQHCGSEKPVDANYCPKCGRK